MLQTQAGQNARVVYSDVFKTAEKAAHRLPGKRVTDTTEPPPLPLGLGCEGLSRPLQLRSTLLLIKGSHLKNVI